MNQLKCRVKVTAMTYLVIFLQRPIGFRLNEANKRDDGGYSVENHVLGKESALDAGECVTRQNEQKD